MAQATRERPDQPVDQAPVEQVLGDLGATATTIAPIVPERVAPGQRPMDRVVADLEEGLSEIREQSEWFREPGTRPLTIGEVPREARSLRERHEHLGTRGEDGVIQGPVIAGHDWSPEINFLDQRALNLGEAARSRDPEVRADAVRELEILRQDTSATMALMELHRRTATVGGEPGERLNGAVVDAGQFLRTREDGPERAVHRVEGVVQGANHYLANRAVYDHPGNQEQRTELLGIIDSFADASRTMTAGQVQIGLRTIETSYRAAHGNITSRRMSYLETYQDQLGFLATQQLTEEQQRRLQELQQRTEEILEQLSEAETADDVTEEELRQLAQDIRAFENDVVPGLLEQAGAPAELIAAIRTGIENFGTNSRVGQLLNIGLAYLQNQEILGTEAAERLRQSLVQLAEQIIDPEADYTRETRLRISGLIDAISRRLGELQAGTTAGTDERIQTLANNIADVDATIEETESEELASAYTHLRDAMEALRQRLETDPSSVTREEYERLEGALDLAVQIAGTLADMPTGTAEQRAAKETASGLFGAVLDSYLQDGNSDRTKTLQFIADEFMQGDAEYRADLASLGADLAEHPENLPAVLQALRTRIAAQAESVLENISDPAIRERLSGLIPGEEETNIRTLFLARQAISLAEVVVQDIQTEEDEEIRQSAYRMVNRAIDALAQGLLSISASQLMLAKEYVSSPEEREQIAMLSDRQEDAMHVGLMQILITPPQGQEAITIEEAARRVAGEDGAQRAIAAYRRRREGTLGDVRSSVRLRILNEANVDRGEWQQASEVLDQIHAGVIARSDGTEEQPGQALSAEAIGEIIRGVLGEEASREQVMFFANLYQREFDVFARGMAMSGTRGISEVETYFRLGRGMERMATMDRSRPPGLISSAVIEARGAFETVRGRIANGEYISEELTRRTGAIETVMLGDRQTGAPDLRTRLRGIRDRRHREDVRAAYQNGISQLVNFDEPGSLQLGLTLLDSARAVESCRDAVDRELMSTLINARMSGDIEQADYQAQMDILIAKTQALAELRELIPRGRTRQAYERNMAAYFDLAFHAQRSGQPQQARAIIMLIGLYGDAVEALRAGGDTTAADENIAFVYRQLGDLSAVRALRTRRFTDIGHATAGLPGRPGRSAWEVDPSRIPGEYTAVVLGEPESAEEAAARSRRLRSELITRRSTIQISGVGRRLDRILEHPESQYEREQQRLERQIGREEAAAVRYERLAERSSGRTSERHTRSAQQRRERVVRLRRQLELVDRSWLEGAVSGLRDSSTEQFLQVAQVQRRALAEEEAGHDELSVSLFRQSEAIGDRADAPVTALEDLDRSIRRLNTPWMHRSEGRAELRSGIDIVLAVQRGQDINPQTGEVIEGELSDRRAAALSRLATRRMVMGSRMVDRQFAAQRARDAHAHSLRQQITAAEQTTTAPAEGASPSAVQRARREAAAQGHASGEQQPGIASNFQVPVPVTPAQPISQPDTTHFPYPREGGRWVPDDGPYRWVPDASVPGEPGPPAPPPETRGIYSDDIVPTLRRALSATYSLNFSYASVNAKNSITATCNRRFKS